MEPLEPFEEIGEMIECIQAAVGRSGNMKRDIKTDILFAAERIEKAVIQLKLKTASTPSEITNSEQLKTTIRECLKEELKALKLPAPVTRAPPLTSGTPSPSYAAAASSLSLSTVQLRPPPYKPAIIVSSKTSSSPSETLSAWQKNITFRDTNFAPESIKQVSNNKLRVEFAKPEHLDITLKKISPINEIEAVPSKKLQPMFILKGISESVQPESLTEVLRNQNDSINSTKPEDIQLKFKRTNKNSNLYNAVFTTTPNLWKSIVDTGKLNVDHQRVHVEEYVPVLQCFRCLQYGHIRKFCKETKSTCSHCASTEHAFKDCPDKTNSSKNTCFNCREHNSKHNISDQDISHSATSVTCPRFANIKSIVRARTDYGM